MMKRIANLALTCLFLLTLLAGCGFGNKTSQKAQEQDMVQDMQKDGSMQPGAQINTSTDSQGNTVVHYDNPDGSGGGGVSID